MSRLDAIVREADGALYPAKDGRIPADMFRRAYPPMGGFGRGEGSHADFRFLAEGRAMTEPPKRVAILGAASAIAQAAARIWAARGARIALAGRNSEGSRP